MNRNELQVGLAEFKLAMKRFRPYGSAKYLRRKRSPEALIAFKEGYLSFEVDETIAALHAEGEWHGRARLSVACLLALDAAPPVQDPLVLQYADGRLQIGPVSYRCDWELESGPMLHRIENPTLIDLLAFDKTLPRNEAHAGELGKQISQAKRKAASAVAKSAKLLAELGITDADLWHLVEIQIKARTE